MKTSFTRIGRAAVSLAAAGTILAAMVVGFATSTNDADAALKWREEAGVAKCKEKDPTCTTTTTTTP